MRQARDLSLKTSLLTSACLRTCFVGHLYLCREHSLVLGSSSTWLLLSQRLTMQFTDSTCASLADGLIQFFTQLAEPFLSYSFFWFSCYLFRGTDLWIDSVAVNVCVLLIGGFISSDFVKDYFLIDPPNFASLSSTGCSSVASRPEHIWSLACQFLLEVLDGRCLELELFHACPLFAQAR